MGRYTEQTVSQNHELEMETTTNENALATDAMQRPGHELLSEDIEGVKSYRLGNLMTMEFRIRLLPDVLASWFVAMARFGHYKFTNVLVLPIAIRRFPKHTSPKVANKCSFAAFCRMFERIPRSRLSTGQTSLPISEIDRFPRYSCRISPPL